MKKISALFFLLGLFSMSNLVAQKKINHEEVVKQILASETIDWDTHEEVIFYMSREEWAEFSAHPAYSETKARETIQRHKDKIQDPQAKALRKQERTYNSFRTTLSDGGSDCWQEPDDTWEQINTNDWDYCTFTDVDCWYGPINLGWSFCFYGTNYTSIYINSKGTISFGSGYIDWTPSEFPGETGKNQIAGYWQDTDFRAIGELFYKVEDDCVLVNFVDAGYYSNGSDKTNTFQMLLTPTNSDKICGDNNVQLCYQDMQWAHGAVGGSGGFNGPAPGNVGADKSTATGDHIQFGRFNLNNSNYNGPYGAAPAQQDGISWLDYKVFNFNVCNSSNGNLPPQSSYAQACDTITVCQNNTIDLSMSFLSPETGQTTSIVVSPATLDGLDIISNSSGNVAELEMTLTGTALNVGFHEIVITATDTGSPVGETEISIWVEVVDVEMDVPVITGNPALCAGSSTELCISPDTFDSYQWSNGCETNCCEITNGSNITVQCNYLGCLASVSTEIDYTPYYLPSVVVEPTPVCFNDTATCFVNPPNNGTYVDYLWEVFPGLDGTMYSPTFDDSTLQAGPGTYVCHVWNQIGCEGVANFIVANTQLFIPQDTWSGAYCDGLEEIVFDGGFANPGGGQLSLYLTSSNPAGWIGSYIEVIVTDEDGVDTEYIFTLVNSTFQVQSIPIDFDYFVQITYYSIGSGDGNNDLTVIDCAGNVVPGLGDLTDGEVYYSAPSACSVNEALGVWTITETPCDDADISDDDQFNMTFTPCEFGMYQLCFTEETCSFDECYEIEFTYAPELSWNAVDPIIVCPGETFTFETDTTDIGGTGELWWTVMGEQVIGGPDFEIGPYASCEQGTALVLLENGCGSETVEVDVIAQEEPLPMLSDQVGCNGDDITLTAVSESNQCADYNYAWAYNGSGTGGNSASLTANQSGTYAITVSNDCFPDGSTAQSEVFLVPAYNPVLPSSILECDEDEVEICLQNAVPEGYFIEWSTGDEDVECVTVSASGTYTVTLTDLGNCNETSASVNVTISSAPTKDPSHPTSEDIIICPGDCVFLELGSPTAGNRIWKATCNGANYSIDETSDNIEYCNIDIPQACLDGTFTVSVSATNACGTVSHNFTMSPDKCDLYIPNIFSPNGDKMNEFFEIEGIGNFQKPVLTITNRWGTAVYESDNYQNNWDGKDIGGNDLAAGTYYYTLVLNASTSYSGYVMIVRD